MGGSASGTEGALADGVLAYSSQTVSTAVRSTVTMVRRHDWSAPTSTALSAPSTSAASSSTRRAERELSPLCDRRRGDASAPAPSAGAGLGGGATSLSPRLVSAALLPPPHRAHCIPRRSRQPARSDPTRAPWLANVN